MNETKKSQKNMHEIVIIQKWQSKIKKYENNIEKIQEKSRNHQRNLSEEQKKDIKRKLGRNRYKNMLEEVNKN